MSVQHVRPQFPDETKGAPAGGDVAGADPALDRHPRHAERQRRRYLLEIAFLERAAGRGVADDADLMAGGRLRHHEVADVAEDAADGRAEAMDDAQAFSHETTSEKPLAHVD